MGPFLLCALNVPLPIAGEINRLASLQCEMGNPVHLIPVGDAAIVLTPRGLLRVPEEVSARNVMVDADFSAA